MKTAEIRENLVQMPVKVNKDLKADALASANNRGVSIRQFTITALLSLVEGDLDLTVREIIEKAKSNSDDRRWKNKNKTL